MKGDLFFNFEMSKNGVMKLTSINNQNTIELNYLLFPKQKINNQTESQLH